MRQKFGQAAIFILVLSVVFYFFQKEIISFVRGVHPSSIQNWLGNGLDVFAGLLNKIFASIKIAIGFVVSIVMRIVANVKTLFTAAIDLENLLNKLLGAILGLISLISGKPGKI